MNKIKSIEGTQHYPIQKYKKGVVEKVEDALAIETPLLIKLKTPDQNIEDLVITMQTPTDTKALVVGFLYTDGIIDQLTDIVSITVKDDEALVTLTKIPINLQSRNTVSTAACGMCGKTSLNAIKLVREFGLLNTSFLFSIEHLLGLNTQLREKQDLFTATGGIHAAALFDLQGKLLVIQEDIGRHNAVDKAIGTLLMNGHDRTTLGLIVSGRAGFELVQKCLVSGIAIMVAVGAPSSLAVDYAQLYGLTLIGFMQNERFNIYTHPERVLVK